MGQFYKSSDLKVIDYGQKDIGNAVKAAADTLSGIFDEDTAALSSAVKPNKSTMIDADTNEAVYSGLIKQGQETTDMFYSKGFMDPETRKAMVALKRNKSVYEAGSTIAADNFKKEEELLKTFSKPNVLGTPTDLAALNEVAQGEGVKLDDNGNIIYASKNYAPLVTGVDPFKEMGDRIDSYIEKVVPRADTTKAQKIRGNLYKLITTGGITKDKIASIFGFTTDGNGKFIDSNGNVVNEPEFEDILKTFGAIQKEYNGYLKLDAASETNLAKEKGFPTNTNYAEVYAEAVKHALTGNLSKNYKKYAEKFQCTNCNSGASRRGGLGSSSKNIGTYSVRKSTSPSDNNFLNGTGGKNISGRIVGVNVLKKSAEDPTGTFVEDMTRRNTIHNVISEALNEDGKTVNVARLKPSIVNRGGKLNVGAGLVVYKYFNSATAAPFARPLLYPYAEGRMIEYKGEKVDLFYNAVTLGESDGVKNLLSKDGSLIGGGGNINATLDDSRNNLLMHIDKEIGTTSDANAKKTLAKLRFEINNLSDDEYRRLTWSYAALNVNKKMETSFEKTFKGQQNLNSDVEKLAKISVNNVLTGNNAELVGENTYQEIYVDAGTVNSNAGTKTTKSIATSAKAYMTSHKSGSEVSIGGQTYSFEFDENGRSPEMETFLKKKLNVRNLKIEYNPVDNTKGYSVTNEDYNDAEYGVKQGKRHIGTMKVKAYEVKVSYKVGDKMVSDTYDVTLVSPIEEIKKAVPGASDYLSSIEAQLDKDKNKGTVDSLVKKYDTKIDNLQSLAMNTYYDENHKNKEGMKSLIKALRAYGVSDTMLNTVRNMNYKQIQQYVGVLTEIQRNVDAEFKKK
jgi:hypothetical protein